MSADADYLTGFDVYHRYNCGTDCDPLEWETIGGTSLASPLIASMWALAGGDGGASYPGLWLYRHLGGPSLYDVATGATAGATVRGAGQCGEPNTQGLGILDCDYPASGSTPSAGDIVAMPWLAMTAPAVWEPRTAWPPSERPGRRRRSPANEHRPRHDRHLDGDDD